MTRRRRVLVVYCHPLPESFTAVILDRVVVALGRHEVRVTDLYAEGFRPELSAEEVAGHLAPPEATSSIAGHAADLTWCDTLILVYPTWWSGQPAMLKGWIDRVWANGVAWELPEGSNRIKPLLGNVRRIVVVTTHGSSKWVNAVEGESGKRMVTRTLRALCDLRARTTWLTMYGIDRSSRSDRQAFLTKVERRLRRL